MNVEEKKLKTNLIPAHGGYRKLASYQSAVIVFDLNVEFCNKFLSNMSNKTYRSYRTYDQMIQAGRSGKQNIAEGSVASGTSKKTEIKLMNVARASLEELLVDLEDFLRVNGLFKWEKEDPRVQEIRKLAYSPNRSHLTYVEFFQQAESAANCLICLIHQTNFLLDRQIRALEKDFLENGGFTERMFNVRKEYRSNRSYKTYTTYILLFFALFFSLPAFAATPVYFSVGQDSTTDRKTCAGGDCGVTR
jgi:restriction system protein